MFGFLSPRLSFLPDFVPQDINSRVDCVVYVDRLPPKEKMETRISEISQFARLISTSHCGMQPIIVFTHLA
eukprot:Awhi_evm1s2283